MQSRPHRKSDEMYPLIEAYRAGQERQKAFCARHEIPVSVFQYWLRRHRDEHSEGGFIQVVPEPAPAEKAHVEVLYPSGTRVRLFSPVTPAYVRSLVTER